MKTGIARSAIGMLLPGCISPLPKRPLAAASMPAQTPALAVNSLPGGVAIVAIAGSVWIAFLTPLPTTSTVLPAVCLRRHGGEIVDIFGCFLFITRLVFIVDGFFGDRVLNEVFNSSLFAALLGVVVTTLHLIALIEQSDSTIARMNIDSIAVMAVYLGGLCPLYQLR